MPPMPKLKSPFAGALSTADAKRTAQLLDVLSCANRLRIVSLLAERKSMTGVELEPLLNLAQPTICHHLKVLSQAGLVRSRKRSVYVDFQLDREAFGALSRLLHPGSER